MSRRLYNVMITNVPGPQSPLYAGEAEMLSTYPVTPLARGQALSIGITSYNGGVYYGLNADREAMPDVDELADSIVVSLAELTYVRDWAVVPTGARFYPHDIDRLGFDGVDIDHEGVESLPPLEDTDGDNIADTAHTDGIEDDYDERYAIAAAVMNSASVRSDIFAVWFIIHGAVSWPQTLAMMAGCLVGGF